MNLRQRQKCRILQPDWMNVEIIEELKEAEKESQGNQPLFVQWGGGHSGQKNIFFATQTHLNYFLFYPTLVL